MRLKAKGANGSHEARHQEMVKRSLKEVLFKSKGSARNNFAELVLRFGGLARISLTLPYGKMAGLLTKKPQEMYKHILNCKQELRIYINV